MGQELEWKLAVPDAATLDAVLAWEGLRALLTEPFRQYHMQTTYYDDAVRSLFSRRITLRRRLENELRRQCRARYCARLRKNAIIRYFIPGAPETSGGNDFDDKNKTGNGK